MKASINRLIKIANKNERIILGLMSGTSLDGLDIALCAISGTGRQTQLALKAFVSLPFEEQIRAELQSVQSKEEVSAQILSAMNAKLGTLFAENIRSTLKSWDMLPEQVDLIASHGVTVFHAPAFHAGGRNYPNSTLQIGDGDHIARGTGIITFSDFRQKNIAAGGQGAPLVAYGDALLFCHPTQYRLLLNIGGISNITFLPPATSTDPVLSTDVGPGNAILNQFMLKYYNQLMDKNGALAGKGTVEKKVLKRLQAHPFFNLPYPKTTGVEEFNLGYFENVLRETSAESLSRADKAATLTALSCWGIQKAIKEILPPGEPSAVFASGGGIYNRTLMHMLTQEIQPVSLGTTQDLGLNPDAKEAALFALLANQSVSGSVQELEDIKGVLPAGLGKVSFPD